jgi:hypothetical protein
MPVPAEAARVGDGPHRHLVYLFASSNFDRVRGCWERNFSMLARFGMRSGWARGDFFACIFFFTRGICGRFLVSGI